MSLKMDGARPRTATDLELKYNFGRTFAEVYGLASGAQKAADEAKMAIDGLDHKEIFNRLTNYGEWQGIYRDSNGDVYINASYIKTGTLDASKITISNSGFVTGKDLGSEGTTIIDAGRIQTGTIDASKITIKNSGFVTGADLGETGTTTIYGGRIATDSIKATSLHLGGLLAVYADIASTVVGGYIGYDDGYNSERGIGMRMYQDGNGAQCVCTNNAARVSYTVYTNGTIMGQTGVVCKSTSLTLDAYQTIQMRFGQSLTTAYGMTIDSFYPAVSAATLGTSSYKWADVYAAGTSFSALVARVEALENA